MKALGKWSINEYHRMIEAGVVRDRSVELLAGEIVEMSPETPIHYSTAKRDAKYLERLLEGLAEVRFNGPITLADSEPEPDIAIVRLPEEQYRDRHPNAADIYLLIEVAKTSLKKDTEVKATIYATAEICEYWVLDLIARQMLVFQNPQNGKYQLEAILSSGTISPLAFSEIAVSIDQLLG